MNNTDLAVAEMVRCKNELPGIVGFQIGTTINEFNLHESRFDQLWQKAIELDYCFFIHPWDMQRGGCHEPFWSPWLVPKLSLLQIGFNAVEFTIASFCDLATLFFC